LRAVSFKTVDLKIDSLKIENIGERKADIVINNSIVLQNQDLECVQRRYTEGSSYLKTFTVNSNLAYKLGCNNIFSKEIKPDISKFIEKYKGEEEK
jgi:hypothetical protein